MSSLTLTIVLASCLAGVALSASTDKFYTTKFDNIDLKQIINNDRLLLSYVKCLTGKSTCTADGEELKKNIPDALATGCSKCSEKQKAGTEIMMKHLIENKPEHFKEVEKIYDPKGVYRQKYQAEAQKRGIKL